MQDTKSKVVAIIRQISEARDNLLPPGVSIVYEKRLIDELNAERRVFESFLKSIDAYDTCIDYTGTYKGRELTTILCYSRLGEIYRYFGNVESSRRMFYYATDIYRYDTRYYDGERKIESKQLAEMAAMLWLAGRQEESRVTIGWILENDTLPSIEEMKKFKIFDELGFTYMWRGYALLVQGRHREAYDSLREVMLLYSKARKQHGIWQVLESYLPKALEPLSAYMCDPKPETRISACAGLEEFTIRLGTWDRYEGLIHYLFLIDAYPDVYSI